MRVVMFTPPDDCVACTSTKLRFDRLGIPYEVAVADDEALRGFRDEGHRQFPVVQVVLGDGAQWSWSGYRHDDINKLARLIGG